MTDGTIDPGEENASESDAAQGSAPKRRRILLIAAIAGGAVVLLAVAAALVVPGIVTDRQAQAAADAFHAEREEWLATFTEEALAPYVELDEYDEYVDAVTALREGTDIQWESASTVSDATELEAACSALAARADGLSAFEDAGAPRLEEVDGGDRNADYAAAQELQEQELPRYEASAEFVEEARTGFSGIAEACAFFLADNEISRVLAEAQNGYVDAHTMASQERVHIGSEQVSGGTLDHYIRCGAETGCIPLDDLEARAAAGDLWDAASDARHLAMAELLETSCPGALQEACQARRELELTLHEAALPVGEALRTEDPVAVGLSVGDGEGVTPRLDAARDDYNTAWVEGWDALTEQLEELTGAASLHSAVDGLVSDAIASISAAASAVSGQ